MSDFQDRFKAFILDDIFWFDKSEVNFGIYKIFRQKEQLIKDKLDIIVANIQSSLSQDNANSLDSLKKILLADYIPGKKAKELPLETMEDIEIAIKKFGNGDTEQLLDQLKAIQTEKKYDATKVYEYLYQFFHLYYEKGDFGYTPRSFRTYTIPYHCEDYLIGDSEKCSLQSSSDAVYAGEETMFTWKTQDSYYIKSSKILNSVVLKLDYEGQVFDIHTQVIEKDDEIKDDKKIKQYRLVSIEKKAGNKIFLRFNLSDHPTPKHTTYALLMLVMKGIANEVDYHTISQDKTLKDYFEELPLSNKLPQQSLLTPEYNEIASQFGQLIDGEDDGKYIWRAKPTQKNPEAFESFFKHKLTGEEDKTQIKAKASKLMLSKREYATKIYTKSTAKAVLNVSAFDFDDKTILETLYQHDAALDFFYRLDRGVNLFYAGVDSDYFIHKNLKRFLSVELDKFIKNYIFVDTDALLRMDEAAQQVALFARVFKKQAQAFIDILASVEEFQKYLWNKRKMVKFSHYVISSNSIDDDSLLNAALNNQAQVDEWLSHDKGLGLVDRKPTLDELKQSSFSIDTKHFDPAFKYKVLSQFENIEDSLNGLLVKSENYQALRSLEPRFKGSIKCIYIDPPYNTGKDGFVYKDRYKEASWLCMMQDRLELAKEALSENGVIFISIDDHENAQLTKICDGVFGEENRLGSIVWNNATDNNPSNIAVEHESIIVYAKSKVCLEPTWKSGLSKVKELLIDIGTDFVKKHPDDPEELQKQYSKWFRENKFQLGKLDRYKYIDLEGIYTGSQSVHNPGKEGYRYNVIHKETGKPCKEPLMGYRFPKETMDQLLADDKILFGKDHNKIIELKVYVKDYLDKLSSVFNLDGRLGANELRSMFSVSIPVEGDTRFRRNATPHSD